MLKAKFAIALYDASQATINEAKTMIAVGGYLPILDCYGVVAARRETLRRAFGTNVFERCSVVALGLLTGIATCGTLADYIG